MKSENKSSSKSLFFPELNFCWHISYHFDDGLFILNSFSEQQIVATVVVAVCSKWMKKCISPAHWSWPVTDDCSKTTTLILNEKRLNLISAWALDFHIAYCCSVYPQSQTETEMSLFKFSQMCFFVIFIVKYLQPTFNLSRFSLQGIQHVIFDSSKYCL